MGIPLEILPHVREQNKRSYFPGPGQTLQLLGIEPGTWLNTRQPRGPRQIGIQSAPGGTRVCASPLVESQV